MERLSFIGNVGQDPQLEYSRSGKPTCKFSVAVSKGRDAQGNQRTEWRKVETWNKLAELCAQYVRKGSKVYVEGVPKAEAWSARDGSGIKTIVVCVAENVEFLTRGDDSVAPAGYMPVEGDGLPF